ncbi:MAG: outer membrane protein transport protein [Campylobacterota bacterium]|nr:outer membrane protein transport protein [Campylobacterota bacterium]
MRIESTKLIVKGIALSLLASTLLHATNGDNLIAVGTKARGMGGTGIAVSHGAESTLINPALITKIAHTEISFGGTLFMPDISAQTGFGAMYDSDADMNVIPEVSIAHRINENWVVGVGMWGTAGMGVDYRNAPMNPSRGDFGNMNMVTNLQLMQFGVPIAYQNSGFSIAVTPILQYGALDINYQMPTQTGIVNVGDGIAQDLQFGFSVGGTYDFSHSSVDGLILGAVYKSKIDMDYSNQLSNATEPFVGMGIFPEPMKNNLEQPAEFGFGIAYQMNQHTFAFDYRQVQWSDAKGYQDFGWDDQDIYAFGYEYTQDNWALRLGYNHASHPLPELQTGNTPAGMAGGAINLFNLLGFPATAEDHYTVGGTYAFSDSFALDLAYVYAPETTFSANTLMGPSTVKHIENSLSFQLTYTF